MKKNSCSHRPASCNIRRHRPDRADGQHVRLAWLMQRYRRLVGGRDDRSFPGFLLPKCSWPSWSRPNTPAWRGVAAERISDAGTALSQGSKLGGQPHTSPGEVRFRRRFTLNGSVVFAEIAMMIPCTKALMNSASDGMPKYTAADIVAGRA